MGRPDKGEGAEGGLSLQQSLLDWKPPEPPDIRGATFVPERDGKRLNAQTLRVFQAMKDGAWRGLREISAITGDPETSVSARLRDLRRFGFTVDHKFVQRGTWHYRVWHG